MQVLPDAVILNTSRAQREILQNPNHASQTKGVTFPDNHHRMRIETGEIDGLIDRLTALRETIENDPAYANRRPKRVIDQIILKLKDGAAAQGRAFP